MLPHYFKFAQNYWYPEIAGVNISSPWTKNIDTCYPLASVLSEVGESNIPGLAIVCSAISGMRCEGWENSNIVIQSLKEKISALFIDLHNGQQDVTSTSPEFLIESIETIFDQINQNIFLRNQTQGLDRYGVSVALALYFARLNGSSADFPDGQIVHEVYVAHVGNCRAYWLTPQSCHQLTLDDSYANLEISRGHSPDREMLNHPFAKVLVQLLGSRVDCFNPTIQRLSLRGNGILMLCSREISDYNLV